MYDSYKVSLPLLTYISLKKKNKAQQKTQNKITNKPPYAQKGTSQGASEDIYAWSTSLMVGTLHALCL